ncbi:MAG: hypothetical protein AAGM22_22805 [Acidobacteriota bacterium]
MSDSDIELPSLLPCPLCGREVDAEVSPCGRPTVYCPAMDHYVSVTDEPGGSLVRVAESWNALVDTSEATS